jgi:hypothetical protein
MLEAAARIRESRARLIGFAPFLWHTFRPSNGRFGGLDFGLQLRDELILGLSVFVYFCVLDVQFRIERGDPLSAEY